MTELLEQIKAVAEARQIKAEIDQQVKDSRAKWEAENQGLLDQQRSLAEEVAGCESMLRDLTLKAYQETGNKAPAPGVGIREVTKLEYDAKKAFDWAIQHAMALKLDTATFEKIAKASPPEFVKIHTDPQATIATDLSNILQEVN